MGARERMAAALGHLEGPVCDDCIWEPAGLSSRQHANQTGRQLVDMGVIRRGRGVCHLCDGGKTVSVPSGIALPLNPTPSAGVADKPWHWEGNVQAALVSYLEAHGWRVLSTADTATKETGIDVKAVDPTEREWWITVKGYPERKPTKTTNPATQARHWFSHALFDVVMYRTKDDGVRLGVAMPAPFPTYEALARRTAWLREAAPFVYFWIGADGAVGCDPPTGG